MKIFDSRRRCFLQHTFGLISIMFSLAFSYTTRVSLRANNASKILRHSKSLARFVAASNSDSSSNSPNLSYSYSLCLQIPTIEEMEEVGALLSVLSNPPDAIFLDGDLGAGKTTFARGFINCKLGIERGDNDQSIRVTSPTYLLSNSYPYRSPDQSINEIQHIDLYRLSGTSPTDFDPLHLNQVFTKCISLIEWPTRLSPFPELLPSSNDRLDIDIAIVPLTDERRMTLNAPIGSTWKHRLEHVVEEGMVDDLLIEEET